VDEHLLISHYNSVVLPYLQHCLMVWGNFEGNRNMAQGETLLKLQKRFVDIIAGQRGCYYENSLFAKYGILKVGDLYQQQLRIHAWKFHNDRLSDSQAAMLARAGASHNYRTRAACSELVVSMGECRLVRYRILMKWGTLTEE
jgi:hypothetical protein